MRHSTPLTHAMLVKPVTTLVKLAARWMSLNINQFSSYLGFHRHIFNHSKTKVHLNWISKYNSCFTDNTVCFHCNQSVNALWGNTVCSEKRTEQCVWLKCRVSQCYSMWYITLPMVFKEWTYWTYFIGKYAPGRLRSILWSRWDDDTCLSNCATVIAQWKVAGA